MSRTDREISVGESEDVDVSVTSDGHLWMYCMTERPYKKGGRNIWFKKDKKIQSPIL